MLRGKLRKKKKQEPSPQNIESKQCGSTDLQKLDMPLMAPVLTHNFGDLIRYFKYNMGAGLIMSTLERMVADAREDLSGNMFGTMIKFISVGIMIFMIMLGAYILISSPYLNAPGQLPPAPPPMPPNLIG